MKTKTLRLQTHYLCLFIFVVFLSACGANMQAGSGVAQGRQALFRGDYPGALTLFQSAAQADPNYIYGAELREGALSFLGRAQYLNGQLAPAKQTLEKALVQHKSDNVARLYLGLTLARLGDRQAGLREIEAGMKGIKGFLDYVTTQFAWSFGQFWDPSGNIRKTIDANLAMIAKGNFEWATLIANGEALGLTFEEEEDKARRDEEQQRKEDFRR